MNTDKTYKGIFWIPSEPENHKNGLLKFLNEIAYVDLFDSFDKDPFNIRSTRRKEFCCIYGRLENGRFCILHKCELSLIGGLGSLTGTLVNFEYIFYSSNQDLVQKKFEFSKIEIKLNTLFYWSGVNSIETTHNAENNISLNYKRPENTETIFSNDLYELKLNHTTSIPFTTHKKSLLVEQDTSLILNLKSDHDILKDFEFIEKIHDLFILFHADKVEINSTFQLTTTENEEYFFCYSNHKRFRNAKSFQDNEARNLFTLKDLQEIENVNVNNIFSSWFVMYQTLSYPIELISKSLSDITMNRQHKFMNLMYGLEYIHSKDLDNELAKNFYQSKDNELIQELENLIPNDNQINRQNFLGKLRSRLEKNRKLSDKFKAFLAQLNIPISELFNETSDDFVDKIVNTRNHFAHVNEKEPRIGIDELYLYNIKLEAILLFIFYLKLGLPSDKIKLKIKMHVRFQKVIK